MKSSICVNTTADSVSLTQYFKIPLYEFKIRAAVYDCKFGTNNYGTGTIIELNC